MRLLARNMASRLLRRHPGRGQQNHVDDGRARSYCCKCYAELTEEDKPAAFSRGFQQVTIEEIWGLKDQITALKEEVKRLRYYHTQNSMKAQKGGASLTN